MDLLTNLMRDKNAQQAQTLEGGWAERGRWVKLVGFEGLVGCVGECGWVCALQFEHHVFVRLGWLGVCWPSDFKHATFVRLRPFVRLGFSLSDVWVSALVDAAYCR